MWAQMNLLSPADILQFILLVVCAVAFYRAGVEDNAPGIVWAGVSAAVFTGTWLFLREGLIGNMLGQVGVLLGIAVVRAILTHRDNQ